VFSTSTVLGNREKGFRLHFLFEHSRKICYQKRKGDEMPLRRFAAKVLSIVSGTRCRSPRFAMTALLSLALLAPPGFLEAKPTGGRFFLMGDGKIHIRNARTGQEARVDLINGDGSFNESGFDAIDQVFGFPTREKGEHVSPRLIFMLDHFSDLFAPGRVINLESGYRSPEYNASLKDKGGNVARTSQHLDGMALDFSIDGVDGKALWDLIRSRDCCGVGHYGGATVHLDSARPRFWEAATSKVKTRESEHNRKIYLSTDYDHYRPGDPVRLSFSSVSDFHFGVKPSAALVRDPEGLKPAAAVQIRREGESDCVMIDDRQASRFLWTTLPGGLPPGRYRIKLDFCRRPFEEMPSDTVSNEIEIHSKGP
jgi:uncharacterized protein YcbK (DUF882 family)